MNAVACSPAPTRTAGFDPQLVARYDVAGPRYTSYPTAPQFHTRFGEDQLRAAAHASNLALPARPLSVYVHVPFCSSPCFYCGCARVITRDPTRGDAYLAYLRREIDLTARLFDDSRSVAQLHLGGGTPNFLDRRQMIELVDMLADGFRFSADAAREYGIEIDARHADAEYVALLGRLGFNRLSVGVQDFDPDVQAAVNRIQGVDQTCAVLDAARAHGFRSVSVDLIYGLPKQTPERFARTLDKIIEIAPDRIAAYGYAHLPERFKAQRRIRPEDMPDAATRLALLELTIERLTGAGYEYIGLDHFALPSDELAVARRQGTLQRNFQGYSTHAACDLIGLGVTSISRIGDSFSQNARDLKHYVAALDAGRLPVERGLTLTTDDLIRADAIQRLMCHGRIDVRAFATRHGIDFGRYFAESLERLAGPVRDGLVSADADRIEILPRGRYLMRNVAMCFDAYLARPAAEPVRYSKAV